MTTTTAKAKLKGAAKKRARRSAKKAKVTRLHSDAEFKKGWREAKAKRAADKKSIFRKKKSRKK